MKRTLINFVWVLLVLTSGKDPYDTNQDWPAYGGNSAGNNYSTLSQINVSNVKNLKVAWTYNAVDKTDLGKRPREIECQPIVVNGILYGTSPELKLFALKANTGKQLWKFDPSVKAQGYNSSTRGVNYWQSGDDKRILYVAGTDLFAINAITGELVKTFGINGRVDFHIGLDKIQQDVKDIAVGAATPGMVYNNILVIGSTVSEKGEAFSGDIRGFDIRTGKLLWVFHTIPQPGEFGYDTWPKDAYKKIGAGNDLGGMVLDEKRGMVYLSIGSPSVDFYGGLLTGENLFSNCILALNANTGKLEWYYQTIHHDLWDLDFPSRPTLATVKRNGKMVDVVVQTGKNGLVYVIDCDKGTSLFPVEERTVPTSGLPGEHASPTQKYPVKPLPLIRQVFTEDDLPDLAIFPEAYDYAKKRFLETRQGYNFIPPSLEGTIYIGIGGGSEWGGNAVDPDGIVYLNVSETPWDVKMMANVQGKVESTASAPKESTWRGNTLFINNCSECHEQELIDIGSKLSADSIKTITKNGRGRMEALPDIPESDRNAIIAFLLSADNQKVKNKDEQSNNDSPYVPPFIRGKSGEFNDANGYPAIKPPWGTLNAIDLNTGEYVWRVPLGEFAELTKKGIPVTGTKNAGGPLVTAGGLIFISGTEDEKIRAFDKKTGKVVWEYQLPAGAFATPITYQIDSKQYVAIAAGGVHGGHKPGGYYIAFALP